MRGSSSSLALAAFVLSIAVLPAEAQRLPEDAIRLQFTAPATQWYAGQRIPLHLRIHLRKDVVLGGGRAQLVQLFRRRLDLPVQLDAPWLRELPEGWRLGRVATGAGDTEIAIGGREGRVRRLPPQGDDLVFEWTAELFVTQPGRAHVPGPTLQFAFATEFREDLFEGRVAENRFEDEVRARALELEIVPVPDTERPPGWGGAIGSFALQARLDRARAQVGEQLRLTLTVQGEGNLFGFAAPRLDRLPGFHVLGRIEHAEPDRRVLVYDLEAVAPCTRFPALELPVFDPEAGRFDLARSEPQPLTVTGEGAADTAPARPVRPLLPIGAARPAPAAPGLGSTVLVLGLVLPWLIGLLAFALERARLARRLDPELERIHAAAHALLAFAPGDEEDPLQLWSEYLGARLRCPAAAVIAPDLEERLRAAGLPEALAHRTRTLLDRLVAARYRRAPSPEFVAAERDLVGELEHAFGAAEEAR